MKNLKSIVLAAMAVLSLEVWAGEGIRIENPWIRAVPPTVQTMAAYMGIENPGTASVTLVSVQSAVFQKAELHETVNTNGMATMVPHKNLVIDAGKKITLNPGGYHLMLITPQAPVREGDSVPLTLIFSDGSKKEVLASVRKDDSVSGHPAGHVPDHSKH
ncbi:MAG: uncharacterized protein HW380_602 [Magnetococcales bacterium]|nr:uncharacterized protein [Magnetococcales bacterium]HIJ83642.1 copper chaperone PCu(A)C [Magnetococcales bacterium]